MDKLSNTNKVFQWHKIANSIDEINFSFNGTAEIVVDEKVLCIIKNGNKLDACSQKCPHAGGIMSNGYIDAMGNIVCPLHGYKFNIQDGRNITGEGYFLKTFPVEIRAGGVFISIKKNKSLI